MPFNSLSERKDSQDHVFSSYLQGGWIGSEIGKTMERYDPAENKWEVIGTMAVPRYYFGCCELQGMHTKLFNQRSFVNSEVLVL